MIIQFSEYTNTPAKCNGIYPFAGAGPIDSGPLAEGVKRRTLEDPVKNGACLTNVRPVGTIRRSSTFRVRKGSE